MNSFREASFAKEFLRKAQPISKLEDLPRTSDDSLKNIEREIADTARINFLQSHGFGMGGEEEGVFF
jgi:hypothetical protein